MLWGLVVIFAIVCLVYFVANVLKSLAGERLTKNKYARAAAVKIIRPRR